MNECMIFSRFALELPRTFFFTTLEYEHSQHDLCSLILANYRPDTLSCDPRTPSIRAEYQHRDLQTQKYISWTDFENRRDQVRTRNLKLENGNTTDVETLQSTT